MGKCVSKHPSAITIASAEYLTSNNKIFIEKYPDSITIKNKNTNSDNNLYISSNYTITTHKTLSTKATTKDITRNSIRKTDAEYYKNDKNLSNNTIVIEDYKNKRTKQEQSKNNNSSNNKNSNNNNINSNDKNKNSTKK